MFLKSSCAQRCTTLDIVLSVQHYSWLPSCKQDIAMPKVPKLIFTENLAYITAKPEHV